MSTLSDAIREGFRNAGWMTPTVDVVTQIEFAVNEMDGRAGNQGEKKARREVACEKLRELYQGPEPLNWDSETVLAIIAEAQG